MTYGHVIWVSKSVKYIRKKKNCYELKSIV